MSITSAVPEQARAQPAPQPSSPPAVRRTTGFGALLLRLHFYTGILVAPFVFMAALTGLLYTATPQIDQIVYGDQLFVDQVGAQARPLSEQVAAARQAHPDGALLSVAPGEGDATTKVVFALPELGENQHTVYVDPYSGEVRGTLTTWFGSTPVTTWLDDLHRNLHLGEFGRHYSEIAASWLWVLALGGLALWWRRSRGQRRRARRLLLPENTPKPGVRRTRSWHAATGVWLAIGLLFLSVTGLTWSKHAGENFALGLDALSAQRPPLSTSLTGEHAATGGGHHDPSGGGATAADPAAVDGVLAAARAGGMTGPVEIGVAEAPGSAWTVAEIDNTWPVHRDRVAIDPATGAITDRSGFADWPLLAQLSALGIQAHMGLLFGLANQLLLAALALGLLCVIVWGYRMWWQRRPTRADRAAIVGAPPAARGAWQQLPTWALAVGLPVVFLVSWVLPLLGIPLLAFLIVDQIVAAVQRRRLRSAAPA